MDMHLRGMVALKVKATGSKMFWHPLSGEHFCFLPLKNRLVFRRGFVDRKAHRKSDMFSLTIF